MELSATLYGLVCALSMGVADFVARFTTRAVGPMEVACGMLATGCVIGSLFAFASGAAFPDTPQHIALAVASGAVAGIGMMCFYLAITLGQLSYVIPLAATYPVWSVLYAVVFQGFTITATIALASAATVVGGWIVAVYGNLEDRAEDGQVPRLSRAARSETRPLSGVFDKLTHRVNGMGRRVLVVACALLAGLALVVSVYLSAPASAASSEIGAFSISRAVAAATILMVLVARGQMPHLPTLRRWAPLIGVQGVLDGMAIFALFATMAMPESALGMVVSSAYGVITVLLGKMLLNELISYRQWAGIALALGGAISLTALT